MSKELAVSEPKSEVAVIFEKINTGLEAFEARKEELTGLAKEAEEIKITTYEDKANLKRASELRKKIKAARVKVENEGKAMRDPLTGVNNKISAKQKELVSIVSPSEKSLQDIEDWYEAEKLKIEQAESARKQALLQDRIDRLEEFGYAIDITFLTALGDEQFEKVLNNARIEFEKDQAIKAEEKRLEDERQAQILKDQEELKALKAKQAEADRIIKERQDELDRQAEALRIQQEEAERKETERIKAEKKAQTNRRVAQLIALGMSQTWEHKQFEGYGEFVNFSSIDDLSDDEWDEKISDITPRIESSKKVQEDKAEECRLRDIEDARQKGIAAEQERQRLASEKEKEDARLAEVKRQEELEKAGDKAKWADMIEKLSEIQVPAMRSNQYRKLAAIAREKLEEVNKLKP